jgi:hypothetical protein
MKKYLLNTFGVLALAIASISVQLEALPYIQLASGKDQLATASTENTPMVVVMSNNDGISEMGWNASKNEITVQKDGVYFVMAVAQVGAKETATGITKGGHINFWFELNGAPMTDGDNWIFASPTARAKTIVNQTVMAFKAGDVLRCRFSSSTAQFGLLAYPATDAMGAAPGVTFTMYKVGE